MIVVLYEEDEFRPLELFALLMEFLCLSAILLKSVFIKLKLSFFIYLFELRPINPFPLIYLLFLGGLPILLLKFSLELFMS